MCFWSKFKLDCSYEIIWDFQFLSCIWPDWIGTGFPQPPRTSHLTARQDWSCCICFTVLLLLNIFREGLVQSFCRGNTAIFWCFWRFLGPYSPTASWDFLQTPQLSALLYSPSSAKCAIRDNHPRSQCSWTNLLLPVDLMSHWEPGAVHCCPVSSSYPNAWLFTSLGTQKY